MNATKRNCPHCGKRLKHYQHPIPTVDLIIEIGDTGIVLIERKNPPFGWALPGGFVEYGETLEESALREAKEETSLDVTITSQFHTYSDPQRDPRMHTVTTVFIARATGIPRASSDAKNCGIFTQDTLPETLAFDHAKILKDYFNNNL